MGKRLRRLVANRAPDPVDRSSMSGVVQSVETGSSPSEPSDASWKIAFLLQLPPASKVVVGAGAKTSRLVSGLMSLGYQAIDYRSALALGVVGAEAVIVLPDTEITMRAFRALVENAAPNAQIFAFFRNRWGVSTGVRSGLRNLLSPLSTTPDRALGRLGGCEAGASWWIPLPRFVSAEEFVLSSAAEEVAASLALSGDRWVGVRARFHEAFGVYRGGFPVGLSALERMLGAGLNEGGLSHGIRVTRFDLRERGVLVLLLSDTDEGRRLVCRVVKGEVGVKSLQRHWAFQEAVRASAAEVPSVSRLLPRPVGVVRIGEHRGWVEERSPGTVSWRMPPHCRDKIDSQLVGFLSGLADLASSIREVCPRDLEREGDIWKDEIGQKLHGPCASVVSDVLEVLRASLLGRTAHFSWVHGDFGYGNALAVSGGDLSAVIDWETASEDGLVGIDFFNFLLQRARTLGARGLTDATGGLIDLIAKGRLGDAACGAAEFVNRFMPSAKAQLLLMGVALRRMVLRDHRYEEPTPLATTDMLAALARWRAAFTTANAM